MSDLEPLFSMTREIPDHDNQIRRRGGRYVNWEARNAELDASIGKRFGYLVITSRAAKSPKNSKLRVVCRCDCGYEKIVLFQQITSGAISGCGTSVHRAWLSKEKGAAVIGERFGLLVVDMALPGESGRGAEVMARCDCGARRRVKISDLRGGSVQTCGGPAHAAIKPQAKRWEVRGAFKTYAVVAEGTGMIKIGRGRDVSKRMEKIAPVCPVQLRIVAISDEDIEASLHDELESFRAHGEWFRHTAEVQSTISRRMTATDHLVPLPGRAGTKMGGKHRCRVCGDFGHHAKTCRRQFES